MASDKKAKKDEEQRDSQRNEENEPGNVNEPGNEPEADTNDGTTSSSSSDKKQKKSKKSKKGVMTEAERQQAAEDEKKAVAELEARLPRPEWYSSDEEESIASNDEEEVEVSDLKKRAESIVGPLVFTILAFICLAFNLASSCPIPWMKGKGALKGRQYGIWLAKKGGLPDLKVNNIHDCSQEMQYWQAAAAFSVMATVASFGAFLTGLLTTLGVGHLGATFALGFYSMTFSLVSWALVAKLFGYNCCNKYKYKDIARLDAGFALTLISFVLMLVALIVLGVHFLTYYTRSIHAGRLHPMRFVYLALLGIVAIFYCVGPAYTQWEKDFPLIKCKVTMWHIEIYDKQSTLSTFLGRKYYKCSTFTRRMKVVAAFNIMSNIFLALAIFNATGACFNPHLRLSSNLLGFVAWIMALVAWLVLIVTRHGHICTTPVPSGVSIWADLGYNGVPSGVENGQIVYDGYKMKEGFALMVTGWALNVVASILNCAIN